MSVTRKGKIARLPHAIREEVASRLLNGESGSKLLPWLNALPEVIAIMAADFGGTKITDQNLSEWRKGGHADWLRRHERIAETKDLANFCTDLAKAKGQSISDGAASIAAGKLLTVLEGLADQTEFEPETWEILIRSLSSLRKGDHNALKLGQTKIRLKQFGEGLEIERQKYQRITCEKFIDWAANRTAADIAGSDAPRADKIDALGKLMFADLWDQEPKK